MPPYRIERARLIRVAETLDIEAASLEEAKALAMEHVPTGEAEVLEDSIDYMTDEDL